MALWRLIDSSCIASKILITKSASSLYLALSTIFHYFIIAASLQECNIVFKLIHSNGLEIFIRSLRVSNKSLSSLSISFLSSSKVARRISIFGRRNINPSMTFFSSLRSYLLLRITHASSGLQ